MKHPGEVYVNDSEIYENESELIRDLVPMTLLSVVSVKGKPITRPLLCLVDSGASDSWIKADCFVEN